MVACEVCGSVNMMHQSRKFNMALCHKHYTQMQRHGKTSDVTRLSPNEIIILDNYAEVTLRNNTYEKVGVALISLCDVERIKKHKWRLHNEGYACTSVGTKVILMHRLIMDFPNRKRVDHKNHNTLDNRRENIRTCTNSQNLMNQRIGKRNTSGKTGVSFNNRLKLWTVQLRKDKKLVFSGYYKSKDDAIGARAKAETIFYEEFAYAEAK